MKDTILLKISGSAEIEKHLDKDADQKEIVFSGIGDVIGVEKKPKENGEYVWTYKIKPKIITDLSIGGQKIEIKPKKGSWSQQNREEIISFWKSQVRDRSEKTHQDVYSDFYKFIDSKMPEFYQGYLKNLK
jgi:hypothetical protein